MNLERRQKINRFIAEKCGITMSMVAAVHDYYGDLNACYDAEGVLTDDQWFDYDLELVAATKCFGVIPKGRIHATAAQRAEALYRVLGGEE